MTIKSFGDDDDGGDDDDDDDNDDDDDDDDDNNIEPRRLRHGLRPDCPKRPDRAARADQS